MTRQDTDHGQRISKLEGAMNGLVVQMENLIRHQEERDKHQSERDGLLFKKLDETKDMTRPNTMLLATWAGVAVMVVFGVAAPVFYNFSEKISTAQTTVSREAELELKIESVKSEVLNDRLKRVESWQDDQLKANLDELRLRRQCDDGLFGGRRTQNAQTN